MSFPRLPQKTTQRYQCLCDAPSLKRRFEPTVQDAMGFDGKTRTRKKNEITQIYFGNGVKCPTAMSPRQLVCHICVLVYHRTLSLGICLFPLPTSMQVHLCTRAREGRCLGRSGDVLGGLGGGVIICFSALAFWKLRRGGREKPGQR